MLIRFQAQELEEPVVFILALCEAQQPIPSTGQGIGEEVDIPLRKRIYTLLGSCYSLQVLGACVIPVYWAGQSCLWLVILMLLKSTLCFSRVI